MSEESSESSRGPKHDGTFTTTHWSVVLAAGDSNSEIANKAIEHLCERYWYPLYVYARRQGGKHAEAEDSVQQFLARFIERKYLRNADPKRGRFRTFLLTCFKNFLRDEWQKHNAEKRGGGHKPISWDSVNPDERYKLEPVDTLTPDQLYEKRWAGDLLNRVLEELGGGYEKRGLLKEFTVLKCFVWGDGKIGTCAEAAALLDMSEEAVKGAVHRLRKALKAGLEAEIQKTVESRADVEAEMKYLQEVLSR